MPSPNTYASISSLLDLPLPVRRAQREDWIARWLNLEHDRCSDPEFAAAFRHVYAHYEAPPEAYLQRALETPRGRLLAGIRFFNRDPQAPFVELLAWDEPDLSQLLPLIRREWSAFRPQAVRVLVAEPSNVPPASGARLDLTVHAAPCSEMFRTSSGREIELQPVTDEALALRLIERVHQDVIQRQPALGRQITAMDADGLSWCQQHGLALFMRVEDAIVGLIACAPDSIGWLQGQVIFEEVVAPEFQGRGLATKAQQALAQLLTAHDPETLLLGTIAHNNSGSRISAERAGRPAVLNYVFLPLTVEQ